IMTKADVMDSLDTLQVCKLYKVNGKEQNQIPFQISRMNIEPVYRAFDGWKTDITGLKTFADLPQNMKIYIDYLDKALKVPVKYISNGPGSDQIIMAL
ncbi:MAG: adenylosuccinate synthetase, partial [Ginsengibacter sp.]